MSLHGGHCCSIFEMKSCRIKKKGGRLALTETVLGCEDENQTWFSAVVIAVQENALFVGRKLCSWVEICTIIKESLRKCSFSNWPHQRLTICACRWILFCMLCWANHYVASRNFSEWHALATWPARGYGVLVLWGRIVSALSHPVVEMIMGPCKRGGMCNVMGIRITLHYTQKCRAETFFNNFSLIHFEG